MTRIIPDLLPVELVPPPGGYSDGVAYLRVHQSAGQSWRAGTGLRIAYSDPEHIFIPAINTHAAFAFRAWLRAAGVAESQLAVVRIPQHILTPALSHRSDPR
ncbi:MAG: hypothetical protein ACR2G2_03790 [Pseudonocardia sp.]